MSKARRWAAIALGFLLACCVWASALDPSLDISQYAHTAWKVRDGFVKGAIFSIAQTPDGYLWLGTELGLLRFDGVRAVPWQPPAGEQLPSNLNITLLVARDGTLWIGTQKGLASWKDGKLARYPEVAGAAISSLLEDRSGKVWFGTVEPNGRLCEIRSREVKCYVESFGLGVTAIYEDQKGNLWVASVKGLWRWAPGPPQQYPFPHGELEVNSIIEDDNGVLLLAANDGLKQFKAGKIESYRLPGVIGQFRPNRFLRSSDGVLWIGSQQGLLHLHHGRVDVFKGSEGLSGDFIGCIFEDGEGDVWVGTQDGLDRFGELVVPTISRKQGLSSSTVWPVQATSDGSIWIGTPGGLDRWETDRTIVYRSIKSLRSSRTDERELSSTRRVTEIANSGLAGSLRALGVDDNGRLWASTGDGVFHFEDGRFLRVPGVPGGQIFSIVGDGHGNVWVLNAEAGLFLLNPKGAIQQIPWSQFKQERPQTMLPDPKAGGIWVGFLEGGIAFLKDAQSRTSYSAANGMGQGFVTSVRFGSDGAVWAATQGGLSRIKDGQVTTLTSNNGLPCDTVHWSIEDDDHDFWLYMPCGLVRVERAELDAWVRDPDHVVKSTIFNMADGIRTVGNNTGYGPRVTTSQDGRIWFTSRDGVSVINPHHIPINKLPPPVHIEQVTADGKSYWQNLSGDASSSHPRLPPLVRDVQIDYTALSFVAPEKIRFRYKLEGLDSDWHEAGNRRQAFYTNLPPRDYRFRVIACNNSGVWNEQGAALDFAIAPAFYQTTWFRVLCVVAFFALLWLAYRARIRRLRRQEKKLRDVVETIPAIAWTAQPDGWVDFSNHHWEEYTGLSLEKGAGSGWEAAVHPDDVKRHAEEWRASVVSGEPFESEARYRRADGVYRWFLVRAVPLRDAQGKIVKWYGTKSDIEDRKNAEQERARMRQAVNEQTIKTQEAERMRIAGELHDGVLQQITSLTLRLGKVKRQVPPDSEATATVSGLQQQLIKIGTDIRHLSHELHPALLQEAGLPVALCAYCEEFGKVRDIPVSCETDESVRELSPGAALCLYRIAQEALGNAAKHAEATKVEVRLTRSDGRVHLSVSDDGVGCDSSKAGKSGGLGLINMRERVLQLDGTFEFDSEPGRGTSVRVTVPFRSAS